MYTERERHIMTLRDGDREREVHIYIYIICDMSAHEYTMRHITVAHKRENQFGSGACD